MTNLQQAVLKALGYESIEDEYAMETLQDVTEHGASCGFSGFIYYHETGEFFAANKDAINSELSELAEDIGMSSIEMVKGFNCLNDNYTLDEVARVMYSEDEEDTQIKNALAWFALEQVAQQLTNA